jgi:hypothetical protein
MNAHRECPIILRVANDDEERPYFRRRSSVLIGARVRASPNPGCQGGALKEASSAERMPLREQRMLRGKGAR